jgi:hypothetical protein
MCAWHSHGPSGQAPSAAWCLYRPWPPRGGHERGGAVARLTLAEERPKRGEVFEESIVVRRGNRRVRRGGRKLTVMAGRR